MSETQSTCIINVHSGIESASPHISKFTHNVDCIKFIADYDFSSYAVLIITDADGKVNLVAEGDNLKKTYNAESGQTEILWCPQREITCDDGVVVYQIAAYSTQEDKAVWYSKEGRLIVTDSINTNDISTELIGSSPNLIMQLVTSVSKTQNNIEEAQNIINQNSNALNNLTNNILNLENDVIAYKEEARNGEEHYNPKSIFSQSGIAVAEALASLVNSAPETLNTLEELASALGNDPNFATTIMEMIGKKVEKDAYNADMGIVNQDIADLEEDLHYHKNNDNNPHRLTKDQIGLGNVDNTADKDKPVSDAVARELNNKVDKIDGKGLSTNDFTDTQAEQLDELYSKLEAEYWLKSDRLIYNIYTEPLWEEYQMPTISQTKELINPKPLDNYNMTLKANRQYNFGELKEYFELCFPIDANDGDVIYVTFKTGSNPLNLMIDTTNTCDIELIPETDTGYEIFGKFNGEIWIVNYSEYTVSEG